MCPKGRGCIGFGGMMFEKLCQLLLTKVSHELEIRIGGSQDECPRPLSYDDKQPIRSIHFHKLNILTISMWRWLIKMFSVMSDYIARKTLHCKV